MTNAIVGIDLGTTFSAIAVLNEIGRPEIVPNAQGERITPSVVSIDPQSKVVSVGVDAVNDLGLYPDRVITEIKRKMGTTDSFEVGEQTFSPADISALILKKLVGDASLIKGEISDVVITVPANWTNEARNATMEAGRLSGVNVTQIINEPTAAALYYATEQNVNGRILIYDFGGGTFDVTVADVSGQSIQIVTSEGDSHLGGKDIDLRILEFASERYEKANGSPLKLKNLNNEERASVEEWMTRCEGIKKAFSRRSINERAIRLSVDGLIFECVITRDEFNSIIEDYIQKSEALIDVVLARANSSADDISDVILVGGSTRLSRVGESIEKIFGKEPVVVGNVDEAVALGAAISAGLNTDQSDLSPQQREILGKVSLVDVCNSYFGTEAVLEREETGDVGVYNSIILGKDTPLPCSESKTYFTIADSQTAVNCTVTQSKYPETRLDLVTIISESRLELPANLPAGSPIEITFSYDENETMHCSFLEPESGRKHEVQLEIGGQAESEQGSRASVDDFLID